MAEQMSDSIEIYKLNQGQGKTNCIKSVYTQHSGGNFLNVLKPSFVKL